MSKGTLQFKFKKNAPLIDRDPTYVGFEILGHKLRWIAARKQEDREGRIWRVLRKEQLSKEVIDELEAYNPNTFASGNTIRRGDMVLGYASIEAANALRAQIDRETKSRKSQVYNTPASTKNVRVIKSETSISKMGAEDFTSNE